jgi:TonB family protein
MSATEASVDIFSAGKDNTIKSFELGEEPLTEETSTPFTDVWEHSLRTFSGTDAPKTITRGNYVPISFVPDQSALYFGLLSNDIEEGQLKAEEQNVVPHFNQIVAEPTRVVVRQQSEDNLKTSDVYPAAVEPLHAGGGANESIVSPSAVTPKKDLADRKKQTSQVSIKPLQARRAPTGSVLAVSSAKAVTTYAPRPDYPEEARSHHIAGSGVCLVLVDPFSGNVTNASIAKSTGSPVLDKSVLRTLRTWKFKPGTVSQVSIPIEFTTETENP